MQRGRNHSSTFNIFIKIIIFLIFFLINILVESKKIDGFSTDLIHVNSPLSPFFNPNITDQGYTQQTGPMPLVRDDSFYLMKISYGTPPVELYQVIDTGSDLSWIQCLPCNNCYQSESAPFNPKSSSTFKFENCSTPHKRCDYNITYEDNSHSRGKLARETITIDSNSHKKEFKDFLFGCGYDNGGHFPHKGAGIVGFNRRIRSFITQLHTEHRGLFSYCMAPPGSPHAGKISFGQEAIISGNNVMTTPLIHDLEYTIMLTGINVGRKNFPNSYSSSNNSKVKNYQIPLIVDSGSKAIYLPNSFYSDIEQKIKNYIKRPPVRGTGGFRLCYKSSLKDADIPKITFHFPGVNLKFSPTNAFIQVGRRRCLSILPTNESSVLGNLAQINYLVGFDLVHNRLSFKATNCATL